jgi:hypothetical protein
MNPRVKPAGDAREWESADRLRTEVLMPNDVKIVVSVVTVIVAAILAYWSGSPIRPDFSTYIMVTAVFMVVAMWIFPEAGVKKGDKSKAR